MSFLIALIIELLRVFVPAAMSGAVRCSVDGARQPQLRDRLRARVRHVWPVVALLAAMASGCVRTVYVPPGEPVRLRETILNVKVWVMNEDGRAVAGRMDLPEGWYALPVNTNEE